MNQPDKKEENPPLFKSWKGWYWLVILFLVALIIFCYFFPKLFA